MTKINNIIGQFESKNLSGNKGKIIKNSSWQIATTLTAKVGSLLFTIILARLMLPEIYGLYGLALSTILFIGAISDMGVGTALLTFMSKTIDKKPGKAKGYFYFLTKWKIFLIVISSLTLLILAKWLAVSYYSKPIYYALLAGAIYLPATIFSGHLNSIFTAKNNFRPQFTKEIIIQISKLTLIPLLIIYFLKETPTELYLLKIIIALSISYFLGGLYILIRLKSKKPFGKSRQEKLEKKEKKDLLLFTIPLSATVLSGVFFGYIDQIMLGHYVESQFLGFYQVAFNLISSASAIITFSAAAVFPVFARLKGERLRRGFRKVRNITLLISILAAIFTFLIAPFLIQVIYGEQYLIASSYLKVLALLLISFPIINLYVAYYTSQEKTTSISILLVSSTILNIILNYSLINFGLKYSMFYAVMGACVATIISRYAYLFGLILWDKISKN